MCQFFHVENINLIKDQDTTQNGVIRSSSSITSKVLDTLSFDNFKIFLCLTNFGLIKF